MPDLPVVPDTNLPADDAMEKVRRRVERLVGVTFDYCEATMQVGTPANKLAIAKNVLPQLIRVLGEQREADVHAEMREALAEMREAFRSTLPVPVHIEIADEDLEDAVVPEDPS